MKDAFGHCIKINDEIAYITSKGVIKQGVIICIQSDKRLKVFIPDDGKEYWTYSTNILKYY